MPRTRFLWQLFAALSALVVGVFAVGSWLTSVEMARLADEAAFLRLEDAAALAADGFAAGVPAPDATTAACRLAAARGLECDIVDPAAPGAADRGPGTGRSSRYDATTGRRILAVARSIDSGPAAGTVIRVTLDSRESDRQLARGQRTMLLWQLGWAAAATALGYLVAVRFSRPVEDLARAAVRLAGGAEGVTMPGAETRELADLGNAIGNLHNQLVERGLTIGRQGTQQQAVLGSMIEGVLAIDSRQRIVSINGAAADLLGLDAATVIGRPLQDTIRNADLRRFALQAIDCRGPMEDDLLLRGPRDRTIRVRGTALRDMSGAGGAVIVLNDVTDIQHLENVRRDFVANVSHELKTPVASIKGFVETLLDGAADDPADARRFLHIIARQADRLGSIIEDLLALSRIEQQEGTGSLPVECVPLDTVIGTVIADCLPRAADRGIDLVSESPPGLEADVNPPLLEQALINLVDNAIKFSEPGRRIWLTATGDATGGHLRLDVRDEGCGIEAEHLPRLFERFYRIDKGRSRKLGGTGLGLSIVKHIAQAHGGTVAVESVPGVGSTFTLRLPLRVSV
ncbi:MAG: PAS domain-containing protein [Planctomycetia bacterium]|nr:PAS domain-containing protein [Planctomycetia bacterium]